MTRTWIWQRDEWPEFRWREDALQARHREIEATWLRLTQQMEPLRQDETEELSVSSLTSNLLKSNAIEGETLDRDSVLSSLARRLYGVAGSESSGDGVGSGSTADNDLAQLIDEATSRWRVPLDAAQLLRWHRLLMTGYDPDRTQPGLWRTSEESMQVVSGRVGRLKVHFEAPPSSDVPAQIEYFIERYNERRTDESLAPWLKSALAHLHLVTIHPWEDGNGRMARIVGDRALADASPTMARVLALAASIERTRRRYYDTLETTQRSHTDVTDWLSYYADVTLAALSSLERRIDRVVLRARFWLTHAELNFRPEQRKLLIRMLDDRDDNFELGISAGQYGRLCRVSKPTATRHLTELTEWGILERVGAARATRYRLKS